MLPPVGKLSGRMSSQTKKRPAQGRNKPPASTGTQRRRTPPKKGAAPAAAKARNHPVVRRSVQVARFLWAILTGLIIAALLFEPTMVWMLGVGLFMVANAEFMGLWLLVVGYGMACLPATFGLLIATRRFWFSLTNGLWVGILYSVAGVLFLEHILTLLG